jgi:hypothetical protein
MATALPPAITLTDPHNHAGLPSPTSPAKSASTAYGSASFGAASFELNYASSSQKLRDRNGTAIGPGLRGRPGSASGRSASVVSIGRMSFSELRTFYVEVLGKT